MDEGLSSFEERPPQAAKVFWNVANGPVGEAAGKGLRGAAKLTVAVGKEAVRVGAPAAGWAMKKVGAKPAPNHTCSCRAVCAVLGGHHVMAPYASMTPIAHWNSHQT